MIIDNLEFTNIAWVRKDVAIRYGKLAIGKESHLWVCLPMRDDTSIFSGAADKSGPRQATSDHGVRSRLADTANGSHPCDLQQIHHFHAFHNAFQGTYHALAFFAKIWPRPCSKVGSALVVYHVFPRWKWSSSNPLKLTYAPSGYDQQNQGKTTPVWERKDWRKAPNCDGSSPFFMCRPERLLLQISSVTKQTACKLTFDIWIYLDYFQRSTAW